VAGRPTGGCPKRSEKQQFVNEATMNTVIDAREKFKADCQEYVVTIEVKVVPKFLMAVAKAFFTGRDLRITHKFNCDPFSPNGAD